MGNKPTDGFMFAYNHANLLTTCDLLINLFYLCAVIVIFYFVFDLYRERIEGTRYLLFGCIAIFLSTIPQIVFEPSTTMESHVWEYRHWQAALVLHFINLLLSSSGYCLAAYGFVKLVRTVKVIKHKSEIAPRGPSEPSGVGPS